MRTPTRSPFGPNVSGRIGAATLLSARDIAAELDMRVHRVAFAHVGPKRPGETGREGRSRAGPGAIYRRVAASRRRAGEAGPHCRPPAVQSATCRMSSMGKPSAKASRRRTGTDLPEIRRSHGRAGGQHGDCKAASQSTQQRRPTVRSMSSMGKPGEALPAAGAGYPTG